MITESYDQQYSACQRSFLKTACPRLSSVRQASHVAGSAVRPASHLDRARFAYNIILISSLFSRGHAMTPHMMFRLPFLGFLLCILILSFRLPARAEDSALRVGVMRARPPIAFRYPDDPEQKLSGFAVDLAEMLGQAMGTDNIYREGSYSQLLDWLIKGDIDYICGMPQQLADRSQVQTLTTSFATNRRIFVGRPDVYIQSERDYKEHTIAIFDDTDTYWLVAESYGAKTIKVYSYQEGFTLLTSGKADAFVVPSGEIASYLVMMEQVPGIRLMGMSLERYPTLIVLAPEQNELKTRLSGELVRLEEAGELERLREKWFGRPLIHRPGLWDEYRNALLTGLGGLLLLLFSGLAWTILLRRRIRAVTRSLSRSERRFQALLEASPDAILSVDAGGTLRFANRSAAEHLLECAGRPLPALECGGDSLRELLHDARQKGCTRATFSPGDDKTFEVIAFSAPDGNSDELLSCCIARDVTERRLMERELIQAERLAVIGKLAAGVAHEINNPLGIVRTNADIIRKLSSDSAVLERLDVLRRNVDRAADITGKLLRLAVPREMETRPLDLAELAWESLNFLQPRLKNVELDTAGLAHPLPILGDKSQLEQIIINLLLNGLESMKFRGRLSLEGMPDTDAEGHPTAVLRVRDSGPGIAPEAREQIFDLFYTTRSSEGFGIGLFVSRRIAERHGGTLRAESHTEGGAVMVLALPAAPAPEEADRSRLPARKGDELQGADAEPATSLS